MTEPVNDNVRELVLARISPPSDDEVLDRIEMRIFECLVDLIEHEVLQMLQICYGLAEARQIYMRVNGLPAHDHYAKYIIDAKLVIGRMSARQRAKLKHPSRSRAEAQRLFEGESI